MAKGRRFHLDAQKLIFMFSLAMVCLCLCILLSDPAHVSYWSAQRSTVQPLSVAQFYRKTNASGDIPTNFSLTASTGAPATSTDATDQEWTATRRLPQALIIGVKKGGTRALLEFLRLHPDVRAAGSEPHFFDRYYDRGLDWYKSLMPKALEEQIVMEKTPRYFVSVDSPSRVHAMSHEVKLIVVVRDPITRAISDYAQIVSKTPAVASFESLSFRNGSSGSVEVNSQWSPLWIGLYAQHLQRWLTYFPLAQMHFVHGERLVTDPAGEMARVQDFLGLDRIVTDKHFYFNQTKGFPCLKKPEGSSQPHCLGLTKGRAHPQIKEEVIRRLSEFYRPHNLRFYEMVGQDFGWK